MSIVLPATRHPYPRLRRFVINVGITTLFNVAIAVILTYMLGVHDASFLTNLVMSMCIGTLAVTFIDGAYLLLWGMGKPPLLPFIALVAASIPSAQYLGARIAMVLLGIPLDSRMFAREEKPVGYLVMTMLIGMCITWFFWNRSRMEHLKAEAETEKARAAAIEKQALQAQLQMLQAQIEPHMLFNTLANLQGLIAVDAQRAQHMLDQLIQYLRATLSSSRLEQTTLAHEFSLIEAYLGLMQVRMGARLSYTLRLPEELQNATVPPMLLQPLVENAIKHGLEPKIGGGHIEVQATQEAGMLKLKVADTGLGLDAAPADSNSTHVGVSNVRERLQVLHGERASFALIPNSPNGAIAELAIPL